MIMSPAVSQKRTPGLVLGLFSDMVLKTPQKPF